MQTELGGRVRKLPINTGVLLDGPQGFSNNEQQLSFWKNQLTTELEVIVNKKISELDDDTIMLEESLVNGYDDRVDLALGSSSRSFSLRIDKNSFIPKSYNSYDIELKVTILKADGSVSRRILYFSKKEKKLSFKGISKDLGKRADEASVSPTDDVEFFSEVYETLAALNK